MTLKSLQAYGKGFQLKVLGSLLTDKKFLLNVRDVVQDSYFDADSHKWIVSQIIEYFDKYHTTITMDVALTAILRNNCNRPHMYRRCHSGCCAVGISACTPCCSETACAALTLSMSRW